MNLPKFFPILLSLFLTCCCYCGYASAQSQAEQEVRKLERAWLDAYEQLDAKTMDTVVADDFTITFPDGSIQTKPQILNMIKASRRPNQPQLRFYTENVQSRVYGDTVILIGRVVTERRQNGNPVKEENRYTDTYVKRGGRWQVVASHLSGVPKPKAQSAQVSLNGSENNGKRAPQAEKLYREFAGRAVRSFKIRDGNMSTLAKPETL